MISFLGVFNADLKFRVNDFPNPGQTIHGNSFNVEAGGKGFNQAVACQRAGTSANMLTWLGDDNFADLAMDTIAREEIASKAIKKIPGEPTGTAMIMVEENSAQNMIVIAPGAANLLDATAIRGFEEEIAKSTLFVTNFEVPFDAAIKGLRLARTHNIPTILDPAPAQKLDSDQLKLIDYLTPNESEAEVLCGFVVKTITDGEKAAKYLVKQGAGCAIITMGEQGCVACDHSGITIHPAIKSGKAIDTTGAGDAFNGAFCAQIAVGTELAQAIKFASIAAGIAVTRKGAATAMPTKVEIKKILSTY